MSAPRTLSCATCAHPLSCCACCDTARASVATVAVSLARVYMQLVHRVVAVLVTGSGVPLPGLPRKPCTLPAELTALHTHHASCRAAPRLPAQVAAATACDARSPGSAAGVAPGRVSDGSRAWQRRWPAQAPRGSVTGRRKVGVGSRWPGSHEHRRCSGVPAVAGVDARAPGRCADVSGDAGAVAWHPPGLMPCRPRGSGARCCTRRRRTGSWGQRRAGGRV